MVTKKRVASNTCVRRAQIACSEALSLHSRKSNIRRGADLRFEKFALDSKWINKLKWTEKPGLVILLKMFPYSRWDDLTSSSRLLIESSVLPTPAKEINGTQCIQKRCLLALANIGMYLIRSIWKRNLSSFMKRGVKTIVTSEVMTIKKNKTVSRRNVQ